LHEDGSPFAGSNHPAMEALRTGLPVVGVVMGIFNPVSGSHSWIQVSASPIRAGSDAALQGVYAVFQDITQQKLAEKVARERDTDFRVAIQTSSDGFWIADLQGHLLDVNEAYEKLSGYTREELLAREIKDLDVYDRDEAVMARMQRILQNGSERFVSVHKARDGRRWPVEVVAAYSPVASGRMFCFIKDLTEQQNSSELIWHQANFDRLTDLPNRALFFDRLSQECSAARRNGKSVALMFADLDAFKAVNDDYGHDAGDVVLRTVAQRWLACVRDTDTIARLGGDEFAIIVGNLDLPEEAGAIASKLVDALAEDMVLPNAQACRVGVSIGIAIYPRNAVEMDSLLQTADKAMYACKVDGKNSFGFSQDLASDKLAGSDWIAFTESHLIGVAEIDEQHRQLVRMVNEINCEISVSAVDAPINTRFDALIAFTLQHFQTEHDLMLQYQYPDLRAHDTEHGQLTSELRQIVQKRGREGDLLVLQKIKDWLMQHIQVADKALGRFLNDRGVH
jgi:diguanylate cyclase (GGDEF)-like protein/hemerythrin-like metal-binding protein/PAS domain S-box-containing protein